MSETDIQPTHQQPPTQTYENKEKTLYDREFTGNDEIPEFDTSTFVRKEEFTTPTKVTIQSLVINRFGNVELKFKFESGKLARVPITKDLTNTLRQRFGKNASDWKNRELVLKAIKGTWNIDNQEVEGYSIVTVD